MLSAGVNPRPTLSFRRIRRADLLPPFSVYAYTGCFTAPFCIFRNQSCSSSNSSKRILITLVEFRGVTELLEW